MSTEVPETVFEPGLPLRRLSGPTASVPAAEVWMPIATGAAATPPEDRADARDEPVVPAERPLLFDEDELARLCAAAAARARARTLAEEVAALRAGAERLAHCVQAELGAFRERERRAWCEARRHLGELLAAAFSFLAPEVLARTERRQLARELHACLEPLTRGGRLRVRAPARLAEELAAGLATAGDEGPVELEVLPEDDLGVGAFRIEAGDSLVECRPVQLIEAVAGALEAVFESAPDGAVSTGGESDGGAVRIDTRTEERDGQ